MLTKLPLQTYFIKTLGCQMNVYDSQKMGDLMAAEGLCPIEDELSADVLILNTCSIREKAQEKVFDQLGRWRKLKNSRPQNKPLLIGVAGCVASQEGDAILKRAPYVDLVLGPQTIHRLPQMMQEVIDKKMPVVDISFPEIEKFDALPTPRAEGVKAFVSIMEGCDKYCSYCVVPYTRGTEISRPFEDVLAECMQLAAQGVREITLLGQNVNHYQGRMPSGETADLALLIEYLSAVEGIGRIRFTTSHPVEFSDSLINAYGQIPQLANHLHLPVQSGSDRILAAMKRQHTALEYKSKIRKLRKVRPDIAISTDIIVGFPGETDQDFEQTMNLVAEIGFDQSFCFIYSRRPGTPAADLPDEITPEKKKERLKRLQDRLNLQSMQIAEAMVGTTQKILIDSVFEDRKGFVGGRTENNRIVKLKGEPSLLGQFVDVLITQAFRSSLSGQLKE